MRSTSLIKAIPQSFYSGGLYREVAREWNGLGFGYMLVAISIFSLPVILLAILYSFTITLDKPFDANYIINQVPALTIKNGELSTQVVMPYYIKDKETGATVAVIDTTRAASDWTQQMKDYKLLMVIGKNQILINKRSETGEKTLYEIPEKMNTIITSDDVREFYSTLIGYSWAIVLCIAPFMILTWFLFRIVVMFFYGIMTKIISLILRAGLSYIDCVRLTSVATTATIALFALEMIFTFHLSGWTYFAVSAVYLFCAVKASKHDTI